MSTALVPAQASALVALASKLQADPAKLYSTLKNTTFKGATDDELHALCIVANEYGLNPMLKEIHAFPAKGGGIVPVVSVDGWVRLVNSQKSFDGMEFEFQADPANPEKVAACTCIIYIAGRSRPVKVTEYFAECFRATEPWRQMPRRMMRHKAFIQCARYAFGFGGVYDEDEAEPLKQVEGVVIESPSFAQPAAQPAALPGATASLPAPAPATTAPAQAQPAAQPATRARRSTRLPGGQTVAPVSQAPAQVATAPAATAPATASPGVTVEETDAPPFLRNNTPAPATAAPGETAEMFPSAPAPAAPVSQAPAGTVAGLLKEAGISEADFLRYSEHQGDPLESIDQIDPQLSTYLAENWARIAPKIAEFVKSAPDAGKEAQ